MSVKVTALAFVVGDAMPGIEFKTAGNKHGFRARQDGRELYNVAMLSIEDHRRDSAGLRYVYPVVSRRAGGVSIGINLNTNNACNWACVYCQVENLKRGGPPAIDLDCLETELTGFLGEALSGAFMFQHVAPESRRLIDVAFSGNGEPTSAVEFSDAVRRVVSVLDRFALRGKLVLRLITNGSLMYRPEVQTGVRCLGEWGGEVWFKIDRPDPHGISVVNGVSLTVEKVSRHLEVCSGLASTWVQTCWFSLDGIAPSQATQMAYCALLQPFAGRLSGVHLYGLARPSMQPEASRLGRLPVDALNAFAGLIQKETGIRVLVSP